MLRRVLIAELVDSILFKYKLFVLFLYCNKTFNQYA